MELICIIILNAYFYLFIYLRVYLFIILFIYVFNVILITQSCLTPYLRHIILKRNKHICDRLLKKNRNNKKHTAHLTEIILKYLCKCFCLQQFSLCLP